jgi:hypothetical protein
MLKQKERVLQRVLWKKLQQAADVNSAMNGTHSNNQTTPYQQSVEAVIAS